MTSSVFSILLVSLVFCISVVDPTGVKIRITNQALNTLRNQAQAIVQEQLINQPFEQFQRFGCTIDRFTIIKLTVHQANLRFRQNSGFQFDIQNSDGRFSFDYDCIYLFSGTKDITAQGLTINMELSLVRTQQRHLTVNMPTCQASVEQIRMTDNPGRLQKLLMSCLGYLFSFLFCPLAVQRYGIPYVNQMLETIPMRAVVLPDRGISIDYSLTRDVQVMDNSLDMSFNGLVFREGEDIPAMNPAMEPVFTLDNLMAYVGVSEFVLNSAAVSFYNAGFLDKKFETPVTKKAAKAALRFRKFLKFEWGSLKAPLSGIFEMPEPPRISISQKQGVTVNLKVDAKAISLPENKEPQLVTSASLTCDVSLMVTIQGSAAGNRLRLSNKNVMCPIDSSDWLVTLLAGLLEHMVNNKVSKFLEDWFKDGVELPLPHGVILTDPLFQYQEGFMVVGGNLDLTPAGRQRMVDRIGR